MENEISKSRSRGSTNAKSFLMSSTNVFLLCNLSFELGVLSYGF